MSHDGCCLDLINAVDYLGLDPTTPYFPPTAAQMRKLFKTLKLLLHPDKAKANPIARHAQLERGFNFVVLGAIETHLGLDQPGYRQRMQTLSNKTQWVSTWNPHRVDGGPLFEPLPSWSRRFTTSPRTIVDLGTLPPSGIKGAPKFDGSDAEPPILNQEKTAELLRMGALSSPPSPPSQRRACIAVARLHFAGATCPCLAVVRVDPKARSGLECAICQGTQHLGTVDFRALVALAGLCYGSMYARMSKLQLLGVFARVPRLALELYVNSLLAHIK
ncbi:uncharacterized protein J3D65DRAFT_307713 [Phyllosticta citribraziliensis]|uniref:J domain-containing protein n=1 Tax=Phyllosticta citribraziliensis TaxID=989973 RepID=A0ABR1LXX9_9PEZI